jgi:heme oxygenase
MIDRTPTADGIMTRLREETRQLHHDTERGAFQQDLLSGRLPQAAYADLLQQLLPVHRVLEAQLRDHSATVAAIGRVVREEQFQESNLCEDLRFLGRDPASVAPLGGTLALIDRIDCVAREVPIALLGIHYVFEGSKNGGRFIAGALRRVHGWNGSDGLRYLDPHGESQSVLWREFKDAMDAAGLSREDEDAVVAEAQETFRGIMRIHEELRVQA